MSGMKFSFLLCTVCLIDLSNTETDMQMRAYNALILTYMQRPEGIPFVEVAVLL